MTDKALPLLGGIEAGGTKCVLAVGRSPMDIVSQHTIKTRSPMQTLGEAADWFEQHGPLQALGIASFGPLDLDPQSPSWGYVTNTPKPGWANCDIAGHFSTHLGISVALDTDVNGAALSEYIYGAGKGTASLAYITVGTGIGGGLVIDGKPVHGTAHPELGHIFPRRGATDSDFAGICLHHGDCLEGLASGPAVEARWGASLSELPDGHEALRIVAGYLAQMCHTVFATCAVEVIVLGGGVMQTPGLLDLVRVLTAEIGADYLPGRSRQRIVAPGLGTNAGIRGALILARDAAGQRITELG